MAGSQQGTVRSAVPGPLTDAGWLRAARWARGLAWFSLLWMVLEGVVGIWQGLVAGSIALVGWGLGSAVEGLASVIVVWRFSGARTFSETAERRARRGVAVSFWLLAPYVAAESVRDLVGGDRAGTTLIGIVVAAAAVVLMPLLGHVKHRLGRRLGSAATSGEGTQNYLCAGQAAGVLLALAVTVLWPASWWLDPVIGLGIAAVAVREGVGAWHGEDCC